MTRKDPPVKRPVSTKPPKQPVARSLSARMAQVKLPRWTYHLDTQDRIHVLNNLKMLEANGRSCQCKNMIRGEQFVDPGMQTSHINVYEVSIDSCYETLKDAVAAIAKRNREREFGNFKIKYTGYNVSRSTRLYLVREYPELVREQLVDVEMEIDTETLPKGATPKASHFQKCASGVMFDRIFQKICALKFPDVVGTESDDE